jgi:hypothetical protein|tara:strand:- start:2279 stop:4120 length:1842 start_codon:yes stop_codon:yes gene_type:complete
MNNNNLENAKALIQQGFAIIPLKKYQKHNTDKNILERDYTLEDILNPIDNAWDSDGNLGINLKKSNLIDIDLENPAAVHFAKRWLPQTLTVGSGKKGITHYFYKNVNNEAEDITIDKQIVEYRCVGQTVVVGATKDKKTDELVERYWGKITTPIDAPQNLQHVVKKIAFFSWLSTVKTFENANTDALKLDSCIKRYTDWNEEERIDALDTFFRYVLDQGHRDLKDAKWNRIVRTNDKETKNAGYNSFARQVDVNPITMKTKLSWIGKLPIDQEYEKTPSRRDFKRNGIDLKALMTEDVPPLKYAVRPILPEGLVLIAGRPKAMKSWTMLHLCYCVENGIKFLNHDVVQGNALYLSLEDSKRRLKDRIFKLGHFNSKRVPECDVEAPYLGFGLEEDIQRWIDESTDPRLIVIDTLARVKPRTKKSSGTAYDLDNELLRNVQKLAISNGVCIVLISHLSKSETEYSFDRITGSAGLQGMTDAFWLMDRGDTENAKASITGRGRDIVDFSYEVKWNDQTYKYEWIGNKIEIERNENRASIIYAMEGLFKTDPVKNAEVKPSQVYKFLDYKAQSKDAKNVSRTMLRMAEGGELHSGKKFGTYKLVKTPTHKEEDSPF